MNPYRQTPVTTLYHGACADCGAPWERETQKPTSPHDIGRRPTCAHSAPRVPATVLDPFIGSGTTAIVANLLGRRAVGIDLNEDYLLLTTRRLAGISLPLGLMEGL